MSPFSMLFGAIDVECPEYTVVETGEGFEIRQYGPSIAAEVSFSGSHIQDGSNGAFFTLAKFIGVGGVPQNDKPVTDEIRTLPSPEPIAMTAPVLTECKSGGAEEIAMTAPVLTKSTTDGSSTSPQTTTTMQFILPSKYATVDQVPRPLDGRVKIRELPPRRVAAVVFSGWTTDEVLREKSAQLKSALESKGYSIASMNYTVARYNPPWTLPFLRKNEIYYLLE